MKDTIPGDGPGSAHDSSSPVSMGMEGQEPQESDYQPPSGSPLCSQAKSSKSNTSCGQARRLLPMEVFRGQARSDAVLSLCQAADMDHCCWEQQPRLETMEAVVRVSCTPWPGSYATVGCTEHPMGHFPSLPPLPGHGAAAPHPPAWGFSPFLSLFHQFVSLVLLVMKVRP